MRFLFDTKTKTKFSHLVVLILVISFALSPVSSIAQNVDDLKQKQANVQARLEQLNKQISAYRQQINTTRSKQASLKNELSIFENEIASTELQIQANETQIEDTNLQIEELEQQIQRRIKEMDDNKKILAELIVQLHQLDNNSLLNLSLGNDSFSSFMDQLQYTESVQDKVYNIVQNVKTIKKKLVEQQDTLKTELSKLEQLKQQLAVTKGALDSQRRQKQALLDQTKGLEKNYQKLLSTSQTEQADLQKEINDLDGSIRARLGNRTISANKGALAMPMQGILTQRYGNTGFTALGYNFHNGIDVAAPAGTPIYAAADGTVVACDTGEAAYGNWCAIKHSIQTKSGARQVVTLYAHMRSFNLRGGQTVKQGDVVGYEGNTGNTTRLTLGPGRGYHLHFTVFDAEGFGISQGKYSKTYGPYSVPYGYTYNPADFL
jgi:murein DD-endopeptidase MepM/ murein hydrolase activator NlpD